MYVYMSTYTFLRSSQTRDDLLVSPNIWIVAYFYLPKFQILEAKENIVVARIPQDNLISIQTEAADSKQLTTKSF